MPFQSAVRRNWISKFHFHFEPQKNNFPAATWNFDLTSEPELAGVKVNHGAKYLRQRWFCSKGVARTHTHTHNRPTTLPDYYKKNYNELNPLRDPELKSSIQLLYAINHSFIHSSDRIDIIRFQVWHRTEIKHGFSLLNVYFVLSFGLLVHAWFSCARSDSISSVPRKWLAGNSVYEEMFLCRVGRKGLKKLIAVSGFTLCKDILLNVLVIRTKSHFTVQWMPYLHIWVGW